jgi:hypothetical protein
MLKTIAGFKIRSKVRLRKTNEGRSFPEWSRINRIALVIEEENNVSKQQMDNFLKSVQKYTEVYYLELNRKSASYSDWNCIYRKGKSLLGLPTKEIENQALRQSYDLVINAVQSSASFATALCCDFRSNCLCSCSDFFGHSDLIIKRHENQTLVSYLEEVVRYIKMIKNKA